MELIYLFRPADGTKSIDRDFAPTADVNAGCDVVEIDRPAVMAACELWRDLTVADLRPMFTQLAGDAHPDAVEYQRQNMERAAVLVLGRYVEGFIRRQGLARAWSTFRPRRRALGLDRR